MIPFIGEADLSAGLIVALFVGLTLMAFVKPLSETAAESASSKVQDAVGIDPQTGQSSGPAGGAFA